MSLLIKIDRELGYENNSYKTDELGIKCSSVHIPMFPWVHNLEVATILLSIEALSLVLN